MKYLELPQYGKSKALVIGINDYQKVSKLTNAVNDAKKFADLLKTMGFEVDELYDSDATRENITSNFFDDEKLPSTINKEDRLIVYFAGHGHSVPNSRDGSVTGYLIPQDGEGGKWSTCIDFNDIVQRGVKRINAKHILFLFDCCFSGIATLRSITSAIPSMEPSKIVEECTRKKAVQIIVAGQDDELVLDQSIFSNNSPFTGALIEGLSSGEADMNKDGVLTATELGVYLDRKVSDVANVYGHNQKPITNRLPGDENGDFVLGITEVVKEQTIEEFRKQINELSIEEQIKKIKVETSCVISTLIRDSDRVYTSYFTFAKNLKELENEIKSLVKVLGKMYDAEKSYQITIYLNNNYKINIDGKDLSEYISLEIVSEKLNDYLDNQISFDELWKTIAFFKKEPDICTCTKHNAKLDLVI